MILLLDRGADLNAKTNAGWTALMGATNEGDAEMVKLLLDRGADKNAKTDVGSTALMRAATRGNADVVKLLLDHGADVNARDNDGWTALVRAANGGEADVVKLLLDHGADVNPKDNEGWTALLRAVYEGQAEVVKLLMDRGSDVKAKNNAGQTALDLAENTQVRDLLKSYLIAQREAAPVFKGEVSAGDTAAQSGELREALQHYVAALQTLPEDALVLGTTESLLTKIIKVVLQLNPPPATPQDAIRHAAYAQAAVEDAEKDAKSSYLKDAINELNLALRIAPWWAEAYFNLGAVLKKANRPGEAAQALQLYLLADPHAQNAQDVQMEIYKLQYEAKQNQ